MHPGASVRRERHTLSLGWNKHGHNNSAPFSFFIRKMFFQKRPGSIYIFPYIDTYGWGQISSDKFSTPISRSTFLILLFSIQNLNMLSHWELKNTFFWVLLFLTRGGKYVHCTYTDAYKIAKDCESLKPLTHIWDSMNIILISQYRRKGKALNFR